jgi:hypothetical protein
MMGVTLLILQGYAVLVEHPPYHPYDGGRGRGGPHNLRFAVMILLQNLRGKSKPMFPAEITRVLSPVILIVGRTDCSEETHVHLDGLDDTGAQASTYKLSITMAYCKA